MEPFIHYKINETANGIEVVLYMDENLTEFSDELGTIPKVDESTLEKKAVNFVKRKFPSLKVKSVKIMAGAMLLTTLGIGTITTYEVSAAEIEPSTSQTVSTSYTVSAGDTLYSIAKQNGTTVDAIKQLNNLSSNVLQIGQTLMISTGSITTPITITHQVVSGDTLYSIANQNGTTVDAIKQANNLSSNVLQIGQTLTIPSGSSTAPVQAKTAHQVAAGDTLYSIATQNGTTVNAIKQANNLSSNILQIGQTLTIPSGSSTAPVQAKTTHQVAAGDTLYSIATQNGTTVNAIKQANNLSSNILQIGQTLTIPSGTTAAPTPSYQTKEQSVVNQEDVEWLAKMIYSEGRGESLEGQIAIGAVIMNRVNSPLFPNDVKEVLFEKSYGYYQFTPAETGVIHSAQPNAQHFEAAQRAINGEDPTNGALFFYNPDKTSSPYLKSRTVSTVIGNHTFSF
ncbi:LysM peptidoglycan-binding domain-containing protein [Ornithinibacillus halophilus]|uniref:N-acetylmuramoyl-L-alanine amidase n=1 Tax=Ornithinibacillus halophilus TaxID=930117 RepID=A0A1M5FTU6_9BACI|nr:LysM peptidoglycan-binding domain-containing protein [Ornithinibacillus halophilus]SHF94896.1 N-acetylmuramoyl-L-alanine amidase [Ornithinibacillus halophilus]